MAKLTTEDFIRKAREVHGNKYDYSKVVYVGYKDKVIITCSKHGDFLQTPDGHSSGKGCSKCVKHPKGTTTETFIQKLRVKHGNKYDYSKVVYGNPKNKIIIICPVHGEFQQRATNHLRGDGCPKCTGGVSISEEEFVERARKRHGNKYDYSKVIYVNSISKVIIGCPIHGDFLQAPTKHINATGCPECGGTKQSNTQKFIEKAKRVHGDRYDYSKVEYVKNSIPVTIICPIHGEFQQQPNNHLLGKCCFKCSKNFQYDTEEFIRKAREVHGDRYDYSKVNYIDNKTKLIIICPEHGEFKQVSTSHLRGSGCPICAGKFMDTEYFIKKAREVHGDRYDYSKVNYITSLTKTTIICPQHGEFKQAPTTHLHCGCPKCAGKGIVYLTYEEAKKIMKPYGFMVADQYWKWWKENKKYCQEIGLPKYPNVTYLKHK